MGKKKKALLIAFGLLVLVAVIGGWIAASILSKRFEPYIREQAIEYLRKRFDSEVELASLRVHVPKLSPVAVLLTRGRGVVARVEGEGISLRHKGRRDIPPMFTMKAFQFHVDLGKLMDEPKVVALVTLRGMEIHIPPKGERPSIGGKQPAAQPETARTSVVIEKVDIDDTLLVLLPKDPKKKPLRFEIHKVQLTSAGANVAMKYDATLTNPKPPGEIRSTGAFGPWAAAEPGDTPLRGEYTFDKADLGVFNGIAGILRSTGRFEGTLDSVSAIGEATVPDFRLKKVGNRVPLRTRFEVLVDGTNGNTVLKPVTATLGTTRLTTSGGVIKHEGDQRRTIALDVSIPDGDISDLLKLAMKGDPFMAGRIFLETKLEIPPLSGTVREKLLLDGRFELQEARFLKSNIQEQIDSLSRRGQGKPASTEIDEVLSLMGGSFRLENEVLTFRALSFAVPGAHVDLAGTYNLDGDALDMHGTLRLQAKVSQTQSGWKRWVLKPADPFFSKKGAGTLLPIKVVGTSKQPKFGLDRGGKDKGKEKAAK